MRNRMENIYVLKTRLESIFFGFCLLYRGVDYDYIIPVLITLEDASMFVEWSFAFSRMLKYLQLSLWSDEVSLHRFDTELIITAG